MLLNESLVCPIQGKPSHIVRALDETERFAREEGMSHKQALHLRLLAEELLGMVGTVLQVEDGIYQIEKDEDGISLHLSLKADAGIRAEKLLIAVSSERKNAAYVGVKGKIRQFLDAMFDANSVPPVWSMAEMGAAPGIQDEILSRWSYRVYRDNLERNLKGAEWDELEKSVLTKLTRDIVVSVRPNLVTLVVKAK